MPKLSIITPCYFNGENIPVTTKVLIDCESNFSSDVEFEYILIDDGSKDNTLEELKKFQKAYPDKVKIIKLSRNFGANNASLAGIHHATGDCCVILAADLQDPPELIVKMYSYWAKGFKLVVASKSQREDSFVTKTLSNFYHHLIRKIALPNSPTGGFDLWLFDKQLKQEVSNLNERNIYLPYLFMWLGYDYVNIPYTRKKRNIGVSQWTFAKKIKSFIDSFVAFTFFPIRLISIVGIVMGLITISYSISLVIARLRGKIDLEGWSTMMVALLIIGSFMMISIGILGEYVWRALDESRSRPNYIIDEIIDNNKGK